MNTFYIRLDLRALEKLKKTLKPRVLLKDNLLSTGNNCYGLPGFAGLRWGNEIYPDDQVKKWTVELHEGWDFNKAGKIETIEQYIRR